MADPFGRPQQDAPAEPRETSPSSWLVPLGLLVVLLGGIAIAVSLFLPLAASPDSRVDLIENRAIWYGGTDVVLGIGVAAPFFAFLRWRGLPLPWWIASVLGVVVLVVAVLAALLIGASSLDDVAWAGPLEVESDELRVGVGVWVGAAGAVLLIAGGALLQAVGPPLSSKQSAATAPEGWYPDPEGPDQRFWDGARWTDARRPAVPLGEFAPPVAPRTLWRRPDAEPPQGG
ncbi:MAG TPA: DUF2510 domain-containing protein [Conexibacter sp.]|nr:DUF2510 domain-containing protein [Conexibacter sp.]